MQIAKGDEEDRPEIKRNVELSGTQISLRLRLCSLDTTGSCHTCTDLWQLA